MNEDKKQKGLLKSISELSFVKKLKSIKHIEIIIVVIFILILLLICFSGNGVFGFLKTKSTVSETQSSATYINTTEYVSSVETKLENLLSMIKDAGNVKVMVSIDSSVELKFATDEVITTNGQKTETETKIILVEVNGKKQPVIVSEKLPNVTGVVVVSSGASNTKVKLDIINAIQTLLNIDSSQIQIFIGN